MVKRFTDTEIWDEDWFIALPRDYRDFWIYIKDKCDHAGVWRPNITTFNKLYDCDVKSKDALNLFNKDKERIIVLKNGRWFLTGFIPFQYGTHLNDKSRMHKSVISILLNNEVKLTSIRPQVEVNQTSIRPQVEVIDSPKDKDKDKNKDKDNVFKEGGMGGDYHCFGEFVTLTAKQLDKLIEKIGKHGVNDYIEALDTYLGQSAANRKKYDSHYHTIMNWWRRAGKKINKKDLVAQEQKDRDKQIESWKNESDSVDPEANKKKLNHLVKTVVQNV